MSNRMNSSKVEMSCFQAAGAVLRRRGSNRMSEGGGITCVLLVYHVMWRIFFNSVPEKEAIDPKEVERRLRDITWEDWRPCQVLLQLILCMMNISWSLQLILCMMNISWSLLYYSCSLCKYQLISHNELISRPAVYFIVSKPVLYKCTICSDSLLLSRHSLG